MDVVTTILVWLGSGFAFAFGMAVGAALMRRKPTDYQEVIKKSHRANELLQQRNDIGEQQVQALRKIWKAIKEGMVSDGQSKSD